MIATQTTWQAGKWAGKQVKHLKMPLSGLDGDWWEGAPNQTQTNETYQQLGKLTAVEVLHSKQITGTNRKVPIDNSVG